MAINDAAINGSVINGAAAEPPPILILPGGINTNVINGGVINSAPFAPGGAGANGNMEGSFLPWTITATGGSVGTVNATFPQPITLEGVGFSGKVGSLEGFFPAWGMEASMGHSLDADMPAFTMEAAGKTGSNGSLIKPFPFFTMEGVSVLGGVGILDTNLPSFTMEAIHKQTNQGGLTGTFPSFSSIAFHIMGQSMSMESSFPVWTLEGVGFNPNDSNMLGDFPVLILDGHLTQEGLNYIKTIVMNLKNQRNTEFTNYDFNSMAQFVNSGETIIGVNSFGIYELTGATDAGTEIDSNVRFGFLDTEDQVFQRLRSCYVSSKTDGDLEVEIITEDGNIRSFPIPFYANKFLTRRVKFGRNMKDRYYSLNIKNVNGSSIVLHKIDLETNTVKDKV